MKFGDAAGIATISIGDNTWTILDATMYQRQQLEDSPRARLTIIGNSVPEIGETLAHITIEKRLLMRRIDIIAVEPKPNSMQCVIKIFYREAD
jgi:hypothetical protein